MFEFNISSKRKHSKSQESLPANISRVPSENEAIKELARHGMPALPGKALGFRFVDTVVWGCVFIEVKIAKWDGHSFMFWFSAQRNKGLIRGHLVMFICDYGDHQTYHLFDAKHPVFYNNGKIKMGIKYMPNPKSKRGWKSDNAMTADLMNAAKDQWQMIEQKRIEISNQIRALEQKST